jgi:hypothetical protein
MDFVLYGSLRQPRDAISQEKKSSFAEPRNGAANSREAFAEPRNATTPFRD